MPKFDVVITRTQTQSQLFTVQAKNKEELEKKLEELDLEGQLAEIDETFDDGEVESIEYEVFKIKPSKNNSISFASEDLQALLD